LRAAGKDGAGRVGEHIEIARMRAVGTRTGIGPGQSGGKQDK
jgi:hypothetical protein